MHKNATKCNETLSKWCKNKHGASKIIDMFETYHQPVAAGPQGKLLVIKVLLLIKYLSKALTLGEHM
jgi:hypothetical protein